MTAEVFESAATEWGDDALGIRNTLSIETRDYWVDDRNAAVVLVDTNYKATRESDYPVILPQKDAVRAATALLRATLAAVDDSDDVDSKSLLDSLLELDTEVHTLRTVLQGVSLRSYAATPHPDNR